MVLRKFHFGGVGRLLERQSCGLALGNLLDWRAWQIPKLEQLHETRQEQDTRETTNVKEISKAEHLESKHP